MSLHKMRVLDALSFRFRNSYSPKVSFSMMAGGGDYSGQFIKVIVAEVVAFAMYAVLTSSITSANVGGVLAGSKGVLVGLVTTFYILAAALLPVRILRHSV